MPESKGRKRDDYVPPADKSDRKPVKIGSSPWVAPTMVALFVIGLLWIVVFMLLPYGIIVTYSFWLKSYPTFKPAFQFGNYLTLLTDVQYLQVLGRTDVKPVHGKAQDPSDPLHTARAAEVTSLWRLAANVY